MQPGRRAGANRLPSTKADWSEKSQTASSKMPPVEVDLVRKKGERYTLAHMLFRIGDSGRRFISSNNM